MGEILFKNNTEDLGSIVDSKVKSLDKKITTKLANTTGRVTKLEKTTIKTNNTVETLSNRVNTLQDDLIKSTSDVEAKTDSILQTVNDHKTEIVTLRKGYNDLLDRIAALTKTVEITLSIAISSGIIGAVGIVLYFFFPR